LREVLTQIEYGTYPANGTWAPLATEIRTHRLPVGLFADLLSAFEQDARGMVYRNYEDLYSYCRRSANPVGRLLLALYGREDTQTLAWSDAICTGLQLVNMWQDIAIDYAKGRVYVPQTEFDRFAVQPEQISQRTVGQAWSELVHAQTKIARDLLLSGRPLARALGGRIGWELRLVIQGGLRIAARIDAVHGDIFRHRPTLNGLDWLRMAAHATAM
jgi:squalene synthase HpnC